MLFSYVVAALTFYCEVDSQEIQAELTSHLEMRIEDSRRNAPRRLSRRSSGTGSTINLAVPSDAAGAELRTVD
jgi:hypothetical protein